MIESFNKKQIGLAVACALALGILSGAARAQDASQQTAKDRAYVDDTRDAVVKSAFGLCWHSGFGPPPAAGSECAPKFAAYVPPPVKSVPVPAPAMVQPPAVVAAPEAPPPKPYEAPQRPARKDRN